MAVPTYVDSSPGLSSIGPGEVLAPDWPVHSVNHLALLFLVNNNEPFAFQDRAGFTQIGMPPQSIGTLGVAGSTRLGVYWCRAISTVMRAPRIWAPPLSHVQGVILTFGGVITSGNPWNTSNGNTAASTTAVSIPIATTTLADCLIVGAVSNATDTVTDQASGFADASLTSIAERFDQNVATGFGSGLSIATGIKAAAGAINPLTATLLTASAQARLSLALRPTVAASAPGIYAFMTLQDPNAPDLEMTFKVTSFREDAKVWRGERERAFAGNFLDSRHTGKRTFRASVDLPDPSTVTAFEDFIDWGPDAVTGALLGPRPLYLRGESFGAIRGQSFVEVQVTVDSLTPIQDMDGAWAAELVLEEV